MAQYPFEYQVYLKTVGSPVNNTKEELPPLEKKTDFTIGDKVVEGVVILEKHDTSLDNDLTSVIVYKLPLCEDVGFYGTPFTEIQKEFPDKKFSAKEIMCYTYLMFKGEKAVLDYDCGDH